MEREALKQIAEKLRRAGASIPAPQVTGTIEGSVVSGLCVALAIVEGEIEALAQPAQEPVAHILQFIKELRPAIGPMAVMGKSKTTQEWFDIVINEIERLQSTKEKNT
jgi:hypothetical protein